MNTVMKQGTAIEEHLDKGSWNRTADKRCHFMFSDNISDE
jgi:hypothetical protein